MPNRRVTISPDRITFSREITSYIYSTARQKAFSLKVHTYIERKDGRNYQLPVVEPLMGSPKLQPYIHDCTVMLRVARRLYVYRIFFKNHRLLNHNKAIFNSCHELFRGDLLVMLVNPSTHAFTSMRLGDFKRFNNALKSIVSMLSPKSRKVQLEHLQEGGPCATCPVCLGIKLHAMFSDIKAAVDAKETTKENANHNDAKEHIKHGLDVTAHLGRLDITLLKGRPTFPDCSCCAHCMGLELVQVIGALIEIYGEGEERVVRALPPAALLSRKPVNCATQGP